MREKTYHVCKGSHPKKISVWIRSRVISRFCPAVGTDYLQTTVFQNLCRELAIYIGTCR